MDGPTIQAAAQQALEGGTRTTRRAAHGRGGRRDRGADRGDDLLEPGRALRRGRGSPRDLASAGGAGLITPDLIPDEAGEWLAAADEHDLDKIFLVAPVLHRRAAGDRPPRACRGFVYATAVMGVTGAREPTIDRRRRPGGAGPRGGPTCRSAWGSGSRPATRPPRSPRYADGVIVGSAFVRRLLRRRPGRPGWPGWRRWPRNWRRGPALPPPERPPSPTAAPGVRHPKRPAR